MSNIDFCLNTKSWISISSRIGFDGRSAAENARILQYDGITDSIAQRVSSLVFPCFVTRISRFSSLVFPVIRRTCDEYGARLSAFYFTCSSRAQHPLYCSKTSKSTICLQTRIRSPLHRELLLGLSQTSRRRILCLRPSPDEHPLRWALLLYLRIAVSRTRLTQRSLIIQVLEWDQVC